MEQFAAESDMILLFDSYSSDSQKLHESFQLAGYHCPVVVIDDDGFLPDNVISLYGYFLKDQEKQKMKKPRYFNQITVPDFWEISGNNTSGKVHNLYKERGRIFYTEPKHKRLVRVVDWLDEKGTVRACDHYNCYGELYARTCFNAKGQKVNKSYFSQKGKEIIVENYVTHDIIVNEGDVINIFKSKIDFIMYFFRRADIQQSRIFYNTLSTPFFVSERLKKTASKRDVLFWQEPERVDIPGNMQIILSGQANRTAEIMVQNKKAYNKLISLGANPDMVHMLGFIYPFKRENQHRAEALICTNSDNIEQCEKLVQELPQMLFHIAALTEMSPKLMAMGNYANVKLYPTAKAAVIDELFEQCDYYLDINHESEIVSAVHKAFMHNHLIFGFKETLHNPNYVAEEHVFPAKEVDQMISVLKHVMKNPELLEHYLENQRKEASAEEKDSYMQFIN